MPSPSQQHGTEGELLAKGYLESQGYRCLDQQWRGRFGELDLVMMDDDELVFVEVKMRKNTVYGHPEIFVNRAKQQRLKNVAREYLSQYDKIDLFWRFDIVAISGDTLNHQISHFRDSIRED